MADGFQARCECGAVLFESPKPPLMQLVCHCTDCQDALSAAHANAAFFGIDGAVVTGDLAAREFTAASGNRTTREACARCGSVMFDRSEGFPTLIGVMAERLASPFEFEPSCHVWTRSKRPGISIPDSLPSYSENITR